MDVSIRGDAEGGPGLRLDHEQFSYAGKFVMTNAGKAVAREDGDVVAALSFNRDRSTDDVAWIRYVTVREDRRGEGIAPRLADAAATHLLDEFDRVRIAVNNPFAYEALYKAAFGYAGEETGIAELVLERPGDRSPERYQSGLDAFRTRDLSVEERTFLDDRSDGGPPDPITDA